MRTTKKWIRDQRKDATSKSLRKIMSCLFSGDQSRTGSRHKMFLPSDSVSAKEHSASVYSTQTGDNNQKPDTQNIEEAESSLRESGCLNYEEARALLGRYEYQKGNIEAALHVFEGIDITAMIPKIKLALARKRERRKKRRESEDVQIMSIHAVSLLLESIYLKSKSLQGLGRYKEAAQSSNLILDIVESSLPDGLPENFGPDCKLQETLSKAVELLPELWKLADSPHESILSYRRALLHHWNLDVETTARIQKEFAIFLLYSGYEASPPNLRSQMDRSFIPRNNVEEAILLLMILLRKVSFKVIDLDPSILDHLSFALSVSGGLRALANCVEGLLPGTLNRKEMYHTLSLCYYGEGEGVAALNLLRMLLRNAEDLDHFSYLLLASRICRENPNLAEDGVDFARRALNSHRRCDKMLSVGHSFLGIALSAHAESAVSDSERVKRQAEALQALETAGRMTDLTDPAIVYHLALENAEQRKLDVALHYAKHLLKLELGSDVKGWLLLARIQSAQKQFLDAEIIVNAALDQTGKWEQGQLLRTKAKLQIAQGQLKNAIETYTQLLAILQVQSKSFGTGKYLVKGSANQDRSLELETWHDLTYVYINLSQWRDAETCLSKSKGITPYSASRCHATGALYEAKGLHKEALQAFLDALDIEPTHVPSLISAAVVLRRLGSQSPAVVRSFLTDAVRFDRMNTSAWHNLGLLYNAEGVASSQEAAECFEAAVFLEETAPIEPFR